MKLDAETKEALKIGMSGAVLFFAVWLVSPLIRIDSSDYINPGRNVLRLFLGLLILLIFLGKWVFDVFAPQGLARKISRSKTILLFIFNIALLGFIVYIVAQAVSLFLSSAISQDASQF